MHKYTLEEIKEHGATLPLLELNEEEIKAWFKKLAHLEEEAKRRKKVNWLKLRGRPMDF